MKWFGGIGFLAQLLNVWGSFFAAEETVTDDFMAERATQEQSSRESF